MSAAALAEHDWQKSRTVFPGDMLWFRDAADFNAFFQGECALPDACAGLESSPFRADHEAVLDTLACGCKVQDEAHGFYYRRTQHFARCSDCQTAEWLSDGYEVDEFGYPSCWDHRHTREERIAESRRNALETEEHCLAQRLNTPRSNAWLASPEGQQWRKKSEAWIAKRFAEFNQILGTPLSKLLDNVANILRRYIVFPLPEQPTVIAAWVVHSWLIDAADYTAYLNVFSAAKRSGKSRVLEVLELLCRNAELTQSGSSAALLRIIDEKNPLTMLLDEVDAIYSKKGDGEAENTRRFLNAGFKRGSKFLRCVGQGAAIEAKKFPAFCAKALAGIDRCLPDTVLDRSIPIELERQSREEKAERFREREARVIIAPIRAELEALAKQPDVINALRNARPSLPEELNDRAQEITEPLIAIADMACGKWPATIRPSLIKLYGGEEDADIGVKLLVAIKGVFEKMAADKLATETIIEELVVLEDGPWAAMFEDALKLNKLQTAASKLARKLKLYKTPGGEKIKPRVIKLSDGSVSRGYHKEDFRAAWDKYLPSLPKKDVTSVTSVTHEAKVVTAAHPVTAL